MPCGKNNSGITYTKIDNPREIQRANRSGVEILILLICVLTKQPRNVNANCLYLRIQASWEGALQAILGNTGRSNDNRSETQVGKPRGQPKKAR